MWIWKKRNKSTTDGHELTAADKDRLFQFGKYFDTGCDKPKILDYWKVYRDYVEHEDELINQRLQRLLIIQGFLFAAFGEVITKFVDAKASNFSFQFAGNWFDCLLGIPSTWLMLTFCIVLAATGGFSAFKVMDALAAASHALDALEEAWAALISCHTIYGFPGLRGGGAPKAHERGLGHVRFVAGWFLTIWAVVGVVLLVTLVFQIWHATQTERYIL
jgi:hypothetical protein